MSTATNMAGWLAGAERVLAQLPPLIMGGAGFSYQLHPNPESLPAVDIIKRAFDLGLRAIDTSPYYEPSEQLMGAALCHSDITSKYQRSDYILITKVGRITEKKFDYSPTWVKTSIARSLRRFETNYLDIVFCHDVEFVSMEDAVQAVGVLFELSRTGAVKCVGISGYSIDILIKIAMKVRSTYNRPLDVVQVWGQLTLQNTQLEQKGMVAFHNAGVRAICSSSPLAIGLLRKGGVPVGALGNWHPAPPELRERAQQAAEWVEARGDVLSSVALRFAIAKAQEHSSHGFKVTTITGIGSMADLEENIKTARKTLRQSYKDSDSSQSRHVLSSTSHLIKTETVERDTTLYEGVRRILGPWLDFDLSAPSPNLAVNQEVDKVVAGEEATSVERTSRL